MKKLFIAVAALAVVLAGCGSMGGGASASGFTVLQSGAHSNVKDPDFKDFHNQADLDAFMATAFNKGDAPKISVDWTKQMVLTGFTGAKKNSGVRVGFTKMDDSDPEILKVYSKVVIPCNTASHQEDQSPFQIVAAPATAKQVHFNDPEQEYQKC